jgi:hypothetical protein
VFRTVEARFAIPCAVQTITGLGMSIATSIPKRAFTVLEIQTQIRSFGVLQFVFKTTPVAIVALSSLEFEAYIPFTTSEVCLRFSDIIAPFTDFSHSDFILDE